MKRFLFFLLMLITVTASAQDIIVKTNGDELQCKILEVSKSEVKYKRLTNLDGPAFTEKKANIFMIKYENGEKEVVASNSTISQTVIEDDYIEEQEPISNIYLTYTTRRKRQTGLIKWGHLQTEAQGKNILKTDWVDYKKSRENIRTGKVFILSSISGIWFCGATSPLTAVGIVKVVRGRRTANQIIEKYNNKYEKSLKTKQITQK